MGLPPIQLMMEHLADLRVLGSKAGRFRANRLWCLVSLRETAKRQILVMLEARSCG